MQKTDRNNLIFELLKKGKKQAEIARLMRITKQRVNAIIKQYSVVEKCQQSNVDGGIDTQNL